MTDHRTVEIAGAKYLIGKLDARKQFHVARRLGPLMTAASGAIALPKAAAENDADGSAAVSALAGPLAAALADMKDVDCDFIIDACLAVCKRLQGTTWAPVAVNGHIMFSDLGVSELMRLSIEVIMESLSGFFPIARPEAKDSSEPVAFPG